jgi:hypothetical protein
MSLFVVKYAVEDPAGETRRGKMPVSASSSMVARTWMCIMLIRYCPSRFKIIEVEEFPSSSDVSAPADPLRRESEHGFIRRGGSCGRPGITPGSQG